MASCLYLCLAKQAKALNANTLARQMLDKILGLQVPQKFQEGVELLMLKSGGSSSGGGEDEVAPLCWRCRRHLPPLATQCARCRHHLAHSLATHEVLPLVRFEPAEGITHEEAMDLIERVPIPEVENGKSDGAGVEILRIGDDIDYSDPFLDKVEEEDEGVVVCSRLALLRLSPACVVTVQRQPLKPLFYRNMLPELPVTVCDACQNLFYLEDYEIQIVTKGQCPFCRHQPEDSKREVDKEDSMVNGSGSSTPRSPSDGHSSWR